MARRAMALGSYLILAGSAVAGAGQPLPVTVLQAAGAVDDGFVFVTPTGPGGLTPLPNAVQGPEIIDNLGRPVWFLPLPNNELAADFRIQTYQGKQVLTWSQGPGFEDQLAGLTTDYIYDNTYTQVASLQAGNGYNADEHEFQLTPQNTALITVYTTVTADLSSVGGPVNGLVLEGIAQEIDVATGAVVFEWHAMDHVGFAESYIKAPTAAGVPYDYFHINSVKLDTDGNLLISSRHTSTIYKVNRTTGAVIWRLGGKLSNFALGPGLPFSYQHDAEAVDATTIRIFDNASNGVPVLPASRVIWVNHDDATMSATIVKEVQHPDGISAFAEGGAQTLPNGDTFVDWGILGRFSEFDPSGAMVFDASLVSGYSSYRGYRLPWVGAPATSPTLTAVTNGDGTLTIDAVWNGATGIKAWEVLGGDSSSSLSQIVSANWNGIDTPITVATDATNLQVVAVDPTGAVLGQSAVLAGPFAEAPPAITAEPAAQTIAEGGTVVFTVAASGPSLTYSWSLASGSPAVPAQLGLSGTVSGATGPSLEIRGVGSLNAGTYTCTVTNSSGTATTLPARLSVVSTSDFGRLVNVSCRSTAGSDVAELITGFAIGGGDPAGHEPVLVRASGPALIPFDVPGTLPDPELQLFSTVGGNQLGPDHNGWGGDPAIAAAALATGAFAWTDPASLDSALLLTLIPGPYTANISGASGDSGVALAEVYDATPPGTFTPSTPHLTNVSARANVSTGGGTLIAGFVIGGSTSATVLIRASGPALQAFALAGLVADPQLQLYGLEPGFTTLLASNDDWGGDPLIAAAAASVGAFAWTDPASPDSALLVTLPPGSYTAEVSGAQGGSGVVLVEVYEVP